MTLEQKIGQLMVVGWQNDRVEDIVELIKQYHFGNVILFTRNIKNEKQLKELTTAIQEAAITYNGVPAFIAIDQEGGNVRRIYQGVSNIPGHMAIGAASPNRPTAASEIGKILGEELKSLGVNFLLAPIADINTNPQNPIIAIRSFSDDPQLVASLTKQMSKAIQKENVVATYKHFIGHGDVQIDSHLDLPYVNKSAEELKKVELVPYATGYFPDAIMTAHILYKNLDDKFPASISNKIINDLLRKDLGFEGLVISDCFEMEALSRAFSLEGASTFAISASTDLIIVSHTLGKQLIVRNAILEAVRNGKITQEVINVALKRIFKFKEKYCQPSKGNINFEHNQQIASEVSLSSITVAYGTPFQIDNDTVVVGVTNYLHSPAEDAQVEVIDVAKMIGEYFNIRYYSIDNKRFNVNEVQSLTKGKKVILALSDSHLTLVQKVLYANLIQSNTRVLLISLRTPYDVLGQTKPECHICIYEYTKLSMQSLMKVLSGEKAYGQLPVKIDKSFKVHSDLKSFLMDNILSYIEEYYAKPLNLESVAGEFLISSGHLSRLFKNKINITFLNYLNSIRIAKVKHLLLTSNLRINEVANLCGYFDINYFTKVFKKNTGMTPSYFRNNYQDDLLVR
jgi:beta-N-acetylhexosaminidase